MAYTIYQIQFDEGIPPFASIRKQFLQQTGLPLELEATINLPTFQTYDEVVEKLANDYSLVKTFQIEMDAELNPLLQKSQYAEASDRRRELQPKLDTHNFVKQIHFNIPNFYRIDFHQLGENKLEFEFFGLGRPYYGFNSLLKVLVNLGGQPFVNDKPMSHSPDWSTLRRWSDYKWYNRPKK
ncbi:hypothetical protein ACAW74_21505 [Fibrella sp. WM1]|uniref:hypothetical protein n=1 Tax=Fibrella musci TaxID=3242485 RepID=UPI003522BCD4